MTEKQIETCKNWLADFLQETGKNPVNEVREKAKNFGFSKLVLKRARKELGVETFRQFDEKWSGRTKTVLDT